LFSSSNNKIYINNFISNTNNVHPDGSNEWNSPSKITYTYKRRTYRNYLGNYWDDYTDVDANNNGIWDNPYSINGDNDNYPLVGRIRNHEIAPYYVHDMAVTDIYTSPHSPTVGQSATIYVTVTNEGDQQENNVPVTVKAYVGLSPFGRQVGSTRVTLSAGESTTESFTWTPSAAETYYLKGEVGIVSGETDTSDNTKTISVSVREQNQPPTCAIELRKQGTTTSINEIKVGEFFDIYVGDSTDDIGIVEVRFSSDDSQDGNPTGTWTSWYDWDTSSDDWDAVSKTKAWSFATEGSKEVWAEVKDDAGQTAKCSANIITEDLYWLAKVIASEAGSVWDVDHWVRCSDEERVAVGWTVLNRLESNEFPNTIKKVVEGGYAHNREPTQEIIDLSKDLLERRIPDPTGGATHFFSPIQQNEEGGYGPFIIPGSDIALIPNWAIPEEYSGEYNNGLIPQYESLPPSPPRIWEMPDHPYRTIDSPTRAAEWVGGLENVSNYYFMFYRPIGKNPPPNPPINLVQFKSDGETKIPVGGTTDERTIILKGNVRDPNGDKVKLQVELRRLDEYDGDFLGEFTQESNLEISGSQVSVPAYELVDDEYHWRARTVDEYGLTSEWMSFGNNDDLDIDFSVKIIPVDSDDDGLTDEEELNYGTDPNIQDSDDDGLSDKLEVDLALEYKPILALSEGELFYPTKVENFLDHSRLMEKPDKWIEGPEVSSESLKIYSTTEYYLDLAFGPPPDNNAEGRNDALRLWDEMEYHKPTTYVNVAPAGEYIAVQYWFFYIYNYFPAEDIFPNLDHEGDWEHVTVFIDRYSRVPVAVTYNRHIFDPEGVWWQNANKVGNHPMIYVGRGSHASYPQIGENYITKYKLDIPIASWDYHWGDGLWIQPRALNIALLQTQPWIYFEGKWGEQEILSPDGLMHRDSYFRNVDLEYQNSGLLYVHVASPVHLHAVDQYNRHVGVNKTGEMEVQIPEAEYSGPDAHPQWIAIHNSSLNITFYTTGIENRTFNMTLKKEKFLESKVHNFINISTTSSAITYVNSTSPNILKIDEDGDGTIDKTLSAPFANFSYSPLAPIVNQTITFDASLSYDPDGYIASCYWDFGDGSNASGSIVQHNYSKPGIYSVTLTVQDNNNQSSSTMVLLDINQPPIASFTYIPEKPVLNQTITFNASSSYDPDGYITNYEWDFGDGNITNTTEEIITHAYASAGDYTVNLTVTDNDGAPSTYTQSIFINRIQKGISYAAWWHDTYASTDSDISLENLKDTCTEWVSLVVTWYQDNASSTEIYRDDNRTPTDDSLIHAINKIHSLNMSVMLKPTVDLQDDNWRGNINFDNIAYSDALGLGWQDWSWDCNRNFESTTSVYRGKYAINVSFEPWGGLSFANPEGVNTDRYDSLEFYINGGERGGQQLRLSVTDDKGNELPSSGGVSINNPKYVHDGIISAKIWKLVSVPLEDLNATNTKIIKINIMDNTGHAQPALYIDDVMLTAPQSKWNEWFSSYEQFILHYADLAEKNNCEQFCVGVEYKGTVQRENNWRDIIEKVKEHYTGPITYASNWDNYQNINWWDASDLDFVGIDAYFPLTEKTDPTVDELKEGWKKWEEEIESWQQRVNKSIVFTEIGYCSLDGTNIEPWNWTYSDIVDLQEQADCYNATFQTFWNKPWLAGIYWWMWDTDPDVGGPLDKSYTPYKKPAESIVKKYYCAEKVSFLYKERLIGGPV
jgi:PKD repeat protein